MSIYIYGCGGHARSVYGVIRQKDTEEEIVLIDSNARENEYIFGSPVKKDFTEREKINFYAIGDNLLRRQLYEYTHKNLIKIISQYTCIGIEAYIGCGSFVGNFSNIGSEAIIGENCIINTGAVIEHECKIGSHTHVAPQSCICGRSCVGENVFVGAGATIIDNISICSNVVIGAGAVVVKDIKEAGVYAGVPAKKIR